MSSFDITSGAIDAAFAVGFYALVVFGARNITHRIRGTEAKASNVKWLWLTAVLLGAGAFVGGGGLGSSEASVDTSREIGITGWNVNTVAADLFRTADYVHTHAYAECMARVLVRDLPTYDAWDRLPPSEREAVRAHIRSNCPASINVQ